MKLSHLANQVLQEFGGVMPENLISFEDAQREFVSVRALAMQSLGVSTTDITVDSRTVQPYRRDDLLSPAFGVGIIPAFVEMVPSGASDETRYKVEIVPVELIPSYEGGRAIAFYGEPVRYRLAWDAWDEGDLEIWYDPVEDITQVSGATDLTFPAAFWMYLVKKSAYNLVRVARVKLAYLDPSNLRNTKAQVMLALDQFEHSLIRQVGEWEAEFRKFRNRDITNQPHLRRTQDELDAHGYNNVTGNIPGDLAG